MNTNKKSTGVWITGSAAAVAAAALLLALLFSVPTVHASTVNTSSSINLSNGLVGWWTMDGKDTNWATGKTNDLSGQGNTGQLISMSTTTSPVVGKIGQALKFNGTTNYVGLATPFFTYPLTVTGWFKTTMTTEGEILSNATYAGGGSGHAIIVSVRPTTGYLAAGAWDGVVYSQAVTTSAVNNGSWHFFSAVFASVTSRKISVDGSAYIENTTSVNPLNLDTMEIGALRRSGLDPANVLNGLIDDVRIYNRALSAGEVKQLYKLGSSVSR